MEHCTTSCWSICKLIDCMSRYPVTAVNLLDLENRLSPSQLVSCSEAQSHYPFINFSSPVQFIRFDLQLIFLLCFSCSSQAWHGTRGNHVKVCTILKLDSCNANTTNCHSLITPGLLLQLQQSLFIKQTDSLYMLIVNTKKYVLSVEYNQYF